MSSNYKTSIDTSFVTGDSPATIDLAGDLGALAQSVVVFNDGDGDISVQMSLDGTTYGDAHLLKSPEAFGIKGASISKVKITWVSNSSYRVVFSDSELVIGEGGEGKAVSIDGTVETTATAGNTDAAGRAEVTTPTTIFGSKLLGVDDAPLLWDENLESGASITASTPTANKPYIDFLSTNTTAGVMSRQTFERFNAQLGKSHKFEFQGVLDLTGGGTGVQRCVGCFDANNGAFFELNNVTINVTTRTKDSGSVVDTKVAQSAWSIDKLDGTGDSGVTLDLTKTQNFIIDYDLSATGRIRFGFEEPGGATIFVHEVDVVNTLTIGWSATPNLPMRWEIITTSSSPASSMRMFSAFVISDGGVDELGVTHHHSTTNLVNANTAISVVYALVGIRLQAALAGCSVEPLGISIVSITTDDFEWQLIWNPTVANTFAYSDHADSCMQVATGNTDSPSDNTVTGGIIVASGFGAASLSVSLPLHDLLRLGVANDGTTLDTLVLCIRSLGANGDFQGGIGWREAY